MKHNVSLEKKRKRTCIKQPLFKDKQIMSDKPQKSSGKGKKTRVCDIYNNAEDQYMCLERAAMLLESLDAKLPTFAKCMLPSNVLYSFWLILPTKFCVMHLPDRDATITLVDESGKEFKTNYLNVRRGLSGGWRGFSAAQKLQQGDILFFHLVGSCKLQVHIVRRYGLEAVEAAVCLMEMHPRVKRTRLLTSDKPQQEDIRKVNKMKRSPNKHIARPPNKWPSLVEYTEDSECMSTLISPSDDHCDNSGTVFKADVFEGSTSKSSNGSLLDEQGCYALNLGYQNKINFGPTTQRRYTPTVAT
uniref:B3 domain-containing protein Os05g0481400-like isoform X2 n=1 Tax=Erigeron canadensis TaxID=72917 RepID=UPI001CB9CB5F|nr:B3 domain-containing protein Os05g0481400-like isoform X2 [Erigeron canadensis]